MDGVEVVYFKCDELNTKNIYLKFVQSLLDTHGLSHKYNVDDFNITKDIEDNKVSKKIEDISKYIINNPNSEKTFSHKIIYRMTYSGKANYFPIFC